MKKHGLGARLLVTLALLGVYRLGFHVPILGVDTEAMSPSVYAADGDPVPPPTKDGKVKGEEKAEPKAEKKQGEDFCPSRQGPCLQEDGSCATDCPGAKSEPTDLDLVVLAALEGEGAGAKAVLASVAEDARAKVEESRKAVFDFIVKAQKEMVVLHRELEQACAEAKAEGKEVSCDVKSALAGDIKAIHGKVREKVAAFAKVIEGQVAAEKVQAVAAEVRKAGDVAKSLATKVKAAVEAKIAEEKKASEERPAEDAPAPEKECQKKT